MPPLRLSDEQLDVVHRLAFPLPPADRSRFLELVAQRLQEQATVGDGTVHRICVECQRQIWTPPAVDGTGHRAYVGKYGR
jgi:hypothetical protein